MHVTPAHLASSLCKCSKEEEEKTLVALHGCVTAQTQRCQVAVSRDHAAKIKLGCAADALEAAQNTLCLHPAAPDAAIPAISSSSFLTASVVDFSSLSLLLVDLVCNCTA